MTEFRHIVTKEEDGAQVRDLMRRHFDFSSRLRGRIKREHRVFLNGESVPGYVSAKAGDVLLIRLPEDRSHFLPENIPIETVYEDSHLMLINKQPGVTVHPTKGHTHGTIANGLMVYMDSHAGENGNPFKIRFVNRLDMDTSGLLIVAKNAYVQNDIVHQMKTDHISKEYVALVCGILTEESGTIDLPIGHPDPDSPCRGVCEGGAPSITHYQVLERFSEGFTLVRLRLATGRTHQIRVHMSHIGHPVAADLLYGSPCPELIGRQALHAASLRFIHPVSKKELRIEAPLPDDMKRALALLRG
ncbi:MAG: RluA family pseudouridine synthase [Firmicutes bacterium]|nr:RluA family pseudouridine synthase [Bacillota bacterium]